MEVLTHTPPHTPRLSHTLNPGTRAGKTARPVQATDPAATAPRCHAATVTRAADTYARRSPPSPPSEKRAHAHTHTHSHSRLRKPRTHTPCGQVRAAAAPSPGPQLADPPAQASEALGRAARAPRPRTRSGPGTHASPCSPAQPRGAGAPTRRSRSRHCRGARPYRARPAGRRSAPRARRRGQRPPAPWGPARAAAAAAASPRLGRRRRGRARRASVARGGAAPRAGARPRGPGPERGPARGPGLPPPRPPLHRHLGRAAGAGAPSECGRRARRGPRPPRIVTPRRAGLCSAGVCAPVPRPVWVALGPSWAACFWVCLLDSLFLGLFLPRCVRFFSLSLLQGRLHLGSRLSGGRVKVSIPRAHLAIGAQSIPAQIPT